MTPVNTNRAAAWRSARPRRSHRDRRRATRRWPQPAQATPPPLAARRRHADRRRRVDRRRRRARPRGAGRRLAATAAAAPAAAASPHSCTVACRLPQGTECGVDVLGVLFADAPDALRVGSRRDRLLRLRDQARDLELAETAAEAAAEDAPVERQVLPDRRERRAERHVVEVHFGVGHVDSRRAVHVLHRFSAGAVRRAPKPAAAMIVRLQHLVDPVAQRVDRTRLADFAGALPKDGALHPLGIHNWQTARLVAAPRTVHAHALLVDDLLELPDEVCWDERWLRSLHASASRVSRGREVDDREVGGRVHAADEASVHIFHPRRLAPLVVLDHERHDELPKRPLADVSRLHPRHAEVPRAAHQVVHSRN